MSEPKGRDLTQDDLKPIEQEDLLSPQTDPRPTEPPARRGLLSRLKLSRKPKVTVTEGPDADEIIDGVFKNVGIETKKTKEPDKLPGMPKPEGETEKQSSTGLTLESLQNSDNTAEGVVDNKLFRDITEADRQILEAKKNPEATKQILDDLSADALLIRQVLESKKGIAGIIKKIDQTLTVKGIKLSNILGTKAVGYVLGPALAGLNLGAPVSGGITGGVIGGFAGYIRGKNITEAASNWQKQLDIFDKSPEDLMNMPDGELSAALGILDSAIREKRVRGSEIELLQVARQFRHIREILAQNKEESNVDWVKSAIGVEEELGGKIAATAGEKYKELYQDIVKGKKKQVWGSALKGAAVGAATGAAFGWLSQHFLSHVPDQQPLSPSDEHNRLFDLKGDLRDAHNDNLTQIISSDHLLSARETISTSPGFSGEGLNQFVQHLNLNQPAHSLVQEAANNNIDLSALTEGGKSLIEFINANKPAFLNASPVVQRQILSFPELASQILNLSVKEAGELAAKEAAAKMTATIVGSIGLANIAGMGIGGYFLGKKGSTEKEAGFKKVAEKAAESGGAKPVVLASSGQAEESLPKAPKAPVAPEPVAPIPPPPPAPKAPAPKTEESEPAKKPEQRVINNESEAREAVLEALNDKEPKWRFQYLKGKKLEDDRFDEGVDYKLTGGRLASSGDLLLMIERGDETGKPEEVKVGTLLHRFKYDDISNGLFRHVLENELLKIKQDLIKQKTESAKQVEDSKPADTERPSMQEMIARARDAREAERAKKEANDVFESTETAAKISDLSDFNSLADQGAEIIRAQEDAKRTADLGVQAEPEKQSETKYLDENYQKQGALDATNLSNFHLAVQRSADFNDPSIHTPLVVIEDLARGRFFLADGWRGNTFYGVVFNPITGESTEKHNVEIKVSDLVSGNIVWYLEKSNQ